MTDEAAKPKRKRRRWIIAVVLLLVVSVACWWNWPRADARFVGKWNYSTGGIVTLGSRGAAINTFPPTDRVAFTWRVEGEKLIFGGYSGWTKWPLTLIASSLKWSTGIRISSSQPDKAYDIVHVAASEITIRLPSGRVVTLTRIPE